MCHSRRSSYTTTTIIRGSVHYQPKFSGMHYVAFVATDTVVLHLGSLENKHRIDSDLPQCNVNSLVFAEHTFCMDY